MEVLTVAKKRANGEGTIRLRSDGRWEAKYTLGYKTKSIYAKTQEEVRKKLNQVLNDIENGVNIKGNNITVSEWLNIWLFEYKKGNIKASSFQGYEKLTRYHLIPDFGKIKLKNLTVDHVQRMVNSKDKAGLSKRTIQYIKSTLCTALNQAIRNRLILHNVAEAVKLPNKKPKERRILTEQEQQELLKTVETENKGFMVKFALFTGLRCGELLGLRWRDVDMENKTITVNQNIQRLYGDDGRSHLVVTDTPKTKSSNRTIPLLLEIFNGLLKHHGLQSRERYIAGQLWNDNGLVFCTALGKAYDPRNFQGYLDRITNKIGIERVNIHALRHAFASRSLERGISLKVVSEMLGHSSIQITADIYSHVSIEHMENELQKLREII